MSNCTPLTLPCTAQCTQRTCGRPVLGELQQRNHDKSRELALALDDRQRAAKLQAALTGWAK